MILIRKEKYYVFIFPTDQYPINFRNKFISDHLIKKGLHIYTKEKAITIKNLKIFREENKKPYIKERLFFNLSHCQNYYCLAVSDNDLGVDIERNRDIKNYKQISSRLFGKIVSKDLFIYEWTKLEAKAKLYGINIFDKKALSLKANYDVYKFLDYIICVCLK